MLDGVSVVDVLRRLPVVLDGVSRDGSDRIVSVISEAEHLDPVAFRSSHAGGGSVRKQLRIVAAMLPVSDDRLPRSMMMLLGNRRVELSDMVDLLADRQGEVSIGKLRMVVSMLREGLPAREIAAILHVGAGKVEDVSAFMGCREARVRPVEEIAFEFAQAEFAFSTWREAHAGLPVGEARETYWRLLLGAHRSLTVFEEAALGLTVADVELADWFDMSRSRARKYLAAARLVVRELECA